MSVNDNIMDIRIRFHRDESPMLFRALSSMDSAPGIRTRNQFVRQLIEMGLLMMEDRMRRQDGLSARVSGGVADEITVSAMAVTRPSGLPTAARPAEAAPAAPAPVPVPTPQIAAVAAPVYGNTAPGDDDRPPPRLGGVRAVRMLDGESFE